MLYTSIPSVKILIPLLVIIVLFTLMFNPFKKSYKYEIVETRDFSCEGMKGFTFTYPVFKGWEVNPGENDKHLADSCTIFLDFSNYPAGSEFAVFPQIQVSKKTYQETSGKIRPPNPENINKLNPNNIEYGEGDMGYDFVVGNSIIHVSVIGDSEEFGFSREQFFKTVIESFNYK